jgi:hypothetical protein
MKRTDIDYGRRPAHRSVHPPTYAGAATARRILVDDLGRVFLEPIEGDRPGVGCSRDAPSPPPSSSVQEPGADREEKAT